MRFLFCVLLILPVVVHGLDVRMTEKHLVEAKQKLKKLGINSDQLKIENLSFWGSCSEAESDSHETDKVVFSLKVKEPVVIHGQKVTPGSEIQVCDGKVTSIGLAWSEKPDERTIKVGKYICSSMADFSEKGDLCRCPLFANTSVLGIDLPAKADLHLFKGKPFGVYLSIEAAGNKYTSGFHKLEKRKLVHKKEWEIINTCGDEIKAQ